MKSKEYEAYKEWIKCDMFLVSIKSVGLRKYSISIREKELRMNRVVRKS